MLPDRLGPVSVSCVFRHEAGDDVYYSELSGAPHSYWRVDLAGVSYLLPRPVSRERFEQIKGITGADMREDPWPQPNSLGECVPVPLIQRGDIWITEKTGVLRDGDPPDLPEEEPTSPTNLQPVQVPDLESVQEPASPPEGVRPPLQPSSSATAMPVRIDRAQPVLQPAPRPGPRPAPPRHRWRPAWVFLATVLLMAIVGYCYWGIYRPGAAKATAAADTVLQAAKNKAHAIAAVQAVIDKADAATAAQAALDKADAVATAQATIDEATAAATAQIAKSLFGKSWFVCDQANRRSMIRIMAIWIIAAALVSVRS